jgi:hypothetical protein
MSFQKTLAATSDRANERARDRSSDGTQDSSMESKPHPSAGTGVRNQPKQEKAQKTSAQAGAESAPAATSTSADANVVQAVAISEQQNAAVGEQAAQAFAAAVSEALHSATEVPVAGTPQAGSAEIAGATAQQSSATLDPNAPTNEQAAQTSAVAADGSTQAEGAVAALAAGVPSPMQLDLEAATALAGDAGSAHGSGKGMQKDSSATTHATASDPGSTTTMNKTKGTDATDGAAASGSGSAQDRNNGQGSGQPPQTDSSGTAAAAQKAAESAGLQGINAAIHVASHGTGASARTAEAPGAAAASGAPEGDTPVAPSNIHVANLMQTMSGAEMHVGMQSGEFGSISIRTTMSQQQMLTQISVDHSDLSQAISAHAATAQTKLGDELGVRALIEVNHSSASSSGEPGGSSPREQRASAQSGAMLPALAPAEPDVGASLGWMVAASTGERLDIRA